MDSVVWHDRPELDDPVALISFLGWNDGGEAASMAVAHAREALSAAPLATIDHEDYADFQVTRPDIVVDGGGARHIDWPSTDLAYTTIGARDIVFVLGDEPRLRWRTFVSELASTLKSVGVEKAALLGAFVGQVPHTLPVPIIGVASEGEREHFDLLPSSYSGPTGIVGVLNGMLPAHGIDVVGLWAATPHYLAGNENPKAAQALLTKAEMVLDVDLGAHKLLPEVDDWVERVSDAMEGSDELRGYVENLEATAPDLDVDEGDLVDEIERFLRDGDS